MAAGGSLLPPILNPSSLYNEEARRDATRIRIYNNVLQHIYNKIKAIARIPGNEKSLWYVVPEFIPGTPRFDVKDCIVYLVWNLRNVGYTVEYTHPNLMFISWQRHDETYRQRESPWAQVLGAAREQVLATATNQAVAPPKQRRPTTATATIPSAFGISPPSYSMAVGSGTGASSTGASSTAASATAASYEPEFKRKTVLKKTSEYRPVSAETSGSGSSLVGTIPSRHVSFV